MISKTQYVALSDFRFQLARFLRFSERASRAAGIMPTQYLLLLHVRGFTEGNSPTVGALAERLQSSPHGTAALVSRCVRLKLISKRRSDVDARRVEIQLTARGAQLVEKIARRHREELQSLRDVFRVAYVS